MRVGYSWLRSYCDPGLSVEELGERLAMRSIELERITHVGPPTDEGFVVGRVLSVEPHPDADRLRVCEVDAGEGARTIVCGAPNVASGQTVPVALPGAVMPDGTMVGFIVGIVEPDATGHVTTLGVAPEHRRRGVAQRMLLKVEEGFRRRGVRITRLEVRSVNTGAQDLYQKLGFAVTQRLPRYYSNGGDGLLMIKSLV